MEAGRMSLEPLRPGYVFWPFSVPQFPRQYLTSWDGTILNSGAQGRLERRDVIKGTEYLRMETLLLSPPLLTALVGIFYFLLFFFCQPASL